MCGTSTNTRRIIDGEELEYLHKLYRGLYFKRDLKKGIKIKSEDLYSSIPYLKEQNQLTSRDYFDNTFILKRNVKKNSPFTKNDIV